MVSLRHLFSSPRCANAQFKSKIKKGGEKSVIEGMSE